jgi:hypothetical protein
VTAVEPAGDQALVHVEAVGQRLLVRLPWESRPDDHATVGVAWCSDDEHRFAAADGPRVP